MTPDERTAAIEAIYARVPTIDCRGLCTNSCTVVPMSVHEGRRLRKNGTPLPSAEEGLVGLARDFEHYRCPALVDGRCTVYELRPLICRLYGAVEDMRCEHGCVPDGGFLTTAEARQLIDEITEAGGGHRDNLL